MQGAAGCVPQHWAVTASVAQHSRETGDRAGLLNVHKLWSGVPVRKPAALPAVLKRRGRSDKRLVPVTSTVTSHPVSHPSAHAFTAARRRRRRRYRCHSASNRDCSASGAVTLTASQPANCRTRLPSALPSAAPTSQWPHPNGHIPGTAARVRGAGSQRCTCGVTVGGCTVGHSWSAARREHAGWCRRRRRRWCERPRRAGMALTAEALTASSV